MGREWGRYRSIFSPPSINRIQRSEKVRRSSSNLRFPFPANRTNSRNERRKERKKGDTPFSFSPRFERSRNSRRSRKERGCRYSRGPKIDPACGDIRNTAPLSLVPSNPHHALITEREASKYTPAQKLPFANRSDVNRPIFNPPSRFQEFIFLRRRREWWKPSESHPSWVNKRNRP